MRKGGATSPSWQNFLLKNLWAWHPKVLVEEKDKNPGRLTKLLKANLIFVKYICCVSEKKGFFPSTDYLKILSANEVVLDVVSLMWGHICTLEPCMEFYLTTCLVFFYLRNPQLQLCHSGPFFNSKGVFRSFIFRNRRQLALCQLCSPEGCVVSVFVHFISFQTAWSLPIHYHKFPWKRGKDIFRNLNNFLQDSFLFPHPLLSYVYSYLHTCTSAWLIQHLYFHTHLTTQLSARTAVFRSSGPRFSLFTAPLTCFSSVS